MYRYKSNTIRVSVWWWLPAFCLLLLSGSAAGADQTSLSWPTNKLGYTAMNGRFALLLTHGGAYNARAVVAAPHKPDCEPSRPHTNKKSN